MNILVLSPGYPDKYKVHYPFVKQLIDEFTRQGHCCSVIAPYSITKNIRFYPVVEQDGGVTVYRPNYISFSNQRIGKVRLTDYFYRRAVMRALRMLPQKPDVVYCHFWECVIDAYPYAKQQSIPLFVASGESSISSIVNPKEIEKEMSDYISGVICVSTKNKEESISLGLTTEGKCKVFPNAVNTKLFHKRNKLECRKQLGFPENAFIVAFVGWFNERKGVQRLATAISEVGGVKSIFIGKGEQYPQCSGILFNGPLPHEQVPVYLGASDVFVLPTLQEGCCNAVVEAMSCGLPIISSDLPFNWDVLDETNSIMINPHSIEELADAIRTLCDDENIREDLAKGALEKAKVLTIDKRAEAILNFISEKLNR